MRTPSTCMHLLPVQALILATASAFCKQRAYTSYFFLASITDTTWWISWNLQGTWASSHSERETELVIIVTTRSRQVSPLLAPLVCLSEMAPLSPPEIIRYKMRKPFLGQVRIQCVRGCDTAPWGVPHAQGYMSSNSRNYVRTPPHQKVPLVVNTVLG